MACMHEYHILSFVLHDKSVPLLCVKSGHIPLVRVVGIALYRETLILLKCSITISAVGLSFFMCCSVKIVSVWKL